MGHYGRGRVKPGKVRAETDSTSSPLGRWLIALIVLGVLARFAIAACSWGTTDIASFDRFGWSIFRDGLLATYRNDPLFNHPPIPGYWACLAVWLTRPSVLAFAFLFRVPMILADAGSAWLIWKIWRDRTATLGGLKVAAMYAWCPAAMLVSGYHGNTDPVYAFLCLLCVYLVETGSPLPGGLALAAAINIKLIPVLLILPLLLSFRKRSDAARFMAGLATGVLPFLSPLVLAGGSFARNALAYNSSAVMWGVNFFLLYKTPAGSPLPPAARIYHDFGRYLLLALVTVWSIVARRRPRLNRYEVAGVTFAIFLVLAPGFGVQYIVILLPLLFAVRSRLAAVYGLCAGLFLLSAYVIFWDGSFPVSSLFSVALPPAVGVVGLAPWTILVYYVLSTIRNGYHLMTLPPRYPGEAAL